MKPIAVVSLVEEHARREHIDHLFAQQGLDFDYFNAINKQQVADTLKKYNLIIKTDRMSLGEVACYLSHYCLWQQVIEHDMTYLMVFEDDIYFSKNAKFLLNDLDWLPNGFDVVKLETMYDRVMIDKGTHLLSEHRLCRMKSRHMGMAGYIISQAGAKKLVAITKSLGIDRPVDHIMFDDLIEQKKSAMYQVFPTICIQDKILDMQSERFASCLEQERQPRPTKKVKLSISQKLNRELVRLWRQLAIVNLYHSLLFTIKGYKKQKITYPE